MSFTDDASSALFSSMDKASRAGQAAKINIEKTRLAQQRQSLMRELGNVAYPTLRSHPELVPEAQEVITRIIAHDQRMSSLDEELASLKSPAETSSAPSAAGKSAVPPAAAPADSQGPALICPRCGSAIAPGDNFCMACGMPRSEVEREARGAEKASETYAPEMELNEESGTTAEPEAPTGQETLAAEEASEAAEGQEQDGATPSTEVSSATDVHECTSTGVNLAEQTSYCPHCGHEVDPGAKFCMWCGRPLNPAPN